MSRRSKNIAITDFKCEKYLAKMLRFEQNFATKKSPVPLPFPEKMSNIVKQSVTMNSNRFKPKPQVIKPTSPPTRIAPRESERGDALSPLRGSPVVEKGRNRSKSRTRSQSIDREPWGQLLRQNRSKERTSNFSNFDPLRTVHFLSKELQSKLQNVLPENDDIHQMVIDMQHALKRIPPEITTLLHQNNADIPALIKAIEAEKSNPAISKLHKNCQTPPTLYQEDTEKFQKIMEENTYKLEHSCKQLEMVCTKLQSEKEMTEHELEEARGHVDILCKKVKELEIEIEEISSLKIRQLENEKLDLQEQLNKALEEIDSLKKLTEELLKQKSVSDKTCAQLEYDMTLLKMEKEKFATMLNVREREVKEIQDEMTKLQDQVNRQLSKLNCEVISKVKSLKSEFLLGSQDNKDLYVDFGDATISSINTNESDGDLMVVKESPCGDAIIVENIPAQDSQDNFLKRRAQIKSSRVELDLPSNKDNDAILEELLKDMTPSCKALLKGAL